MTHARESAKSLAAVHAELVSLVLWIDERDSDLSLPTDQRGRMAAGCFDVGLEHQAAITLFAGEELFGSASALLRVLFEACVRSMWIAHCASEQQFHVL